MSENFGKPGFSNVLSERMVQEFPNTSTTILKKVWAPNCPKKMHFFQDPGGCDGKVAFTKIIFGGNRHFDVLPLGDFFAYILNAHSDIRLAG